MAVFSLLYMAPAVKSRALAGHAASCSIWPGGSDLRQSLAMPKRPAPSAARKEAAEKMGRLIRERRKQLELRIVDLQHAAKVTWPTAQSWDKGKSIPSGEHLLAIARVLQMSPHEFQALLDEAPPDWPAWTEFVEREDGGKTLSTDQRRRVARAARMMLDEDEQATLAQLVFLAAAVRGRA